MWYQNRSFTESASSLEILGAISPRLALLRQGNFIAWFPALWQLLQLCTIVVPKAPKSGTDVV